MRLRLLLPAVFAFAAVAPSGMYAQSGHKTTDVSKMVGASYKTGDNTGSHFALIDSEAYVYSGSALGQAMLSGSAESPYPQYTGKYDTLTTYAYGGTTIGYYPSKKTYEIFDVSNNLIYQTTQRYDTSAASWNDSYRYTFTYDAHNNTTSQTFQVWDGSLSSWHDSTRSGYTYDASDNMVTDTFTNLSNASRNSLYTYYYDGSHNVTSYIYMKWSTMSSSYTNNSKVVYVPSSNNPTSDTSYYYFGGSWKYGGLDVYTYSGANEITDTIKSYFSSWNNSRLNIYSYDGSNNQIGDSLLVWNRTSSLWVDSLYYSNTFDASNNEMQSLKNLYNVGPATWVVYSRDTMSYNSYNQLTGFTTQKWNPGLSQWVEIRNSDIQNTYYYQTTSAVPTVQKAAGYVQVYPSPANSRLNIDLKWNNAQSALISIYDMNGRVWTQLRTDNTASYHNQIPVSQLPAGNYVIKVKGEGGQLTQPFTVVH